MFSTLESNWDQSARRGRATLASFTIQTFSLSLLIAVSMLWVERPPQVRWLQISAPTTFTPTEPAPEPVTHRHFTAATVSNLLRGQIIMPRTIPPHAVDIDDSKLGPPAPNLPDIDFRSGHGPRDAVPYGLGSNIPVVIPTHPTVPKPLIVSNLGEGSLVHRVQPAYPPLARQARVQGTVELRAIISKSGTIENLVVVRGHPMLAGAAVEAVRQWRYRPYLLNNEPVEVETEVVVNFVLSGG
ncbi:MAG: TonB family protein [Acidobacteriia bacterium]|nr:TonB family protein [Terriglobia bacterium]